MRLLHCKYSGRSRVIRGREGGRVERSNERGGISREGEARAKPGNQLVNNIIIHSKSNKSTGFDNIDSYIVKQIAPQIVNQLANIFNKSFLTGILPNKLKIAKVIPLYKTKDPALFSNYRPISLLPFFSKNTRTINA